MSAVATINIISLILGLATQYGPKLVADVANLIHNNPIQAGETEDQYIARLNAEITKNLDQAAANDASVQGS